MRVEYLLDRIRVESRSDKLRPFMGWGFFYFEFMRGVNMINVTLKGGVVKQFDSGISAAEIAKSLGMGLYKSSCCCKIDGEVKDLRTQINSDCELEILTFDSNDGKKAFWHTSSHILAQAIKRLYPDAKLAVGPATDNGFFYDIDVDKPFSSDDLDRIEAEMKKIVKSGLEIERFVLPVDEAID